MSQVTVELRNVAGTEAALGWAGSRTIVVDRPPGKAGGQGLGFNGAEILSLAIGGCFCNDLRYAAHAVGIALSAISVTVTLDLEGDPLVTKSAEMRVACETADGSDPAPVVARAEAITMVARSLRRGFPVAIRPATTA
jgi:organic hydroperoxide reductase OsmC/OhrA